MDSLNIMMHKDDVKTLTRNLLTFDTLKRDAGMNLLIAYDEDDIQILSGLSQGDVHFLCSKPNGG